jgi:MoxR-like ATPase
MAIFYSKVPNDRKAVYEAAEKWKNECLLRDGSLIWDGEAIWTEQNMNRFRSIFIERPDESGDSFDDKLKKQLENETEAVYKFVIEMLFMYHLYTSSVSYETKMNKLETVASWKGIKINRSLPIFDSLKEGMGSTGTYFNVQKYFEISFLFLVTDYIKRQPIEKRKELLESPTDLKNMAEEIRQKQIGKRVQMIHVFLHLLLPDYFEPIASWGHKKSIIKAFNNLLPENSSTDMDDQLLIIREKLQEDDPKNQINFYDSPFVDKWLDTNVKKEPNFFLVISDPETWTVDEIKDGSVVNFTTYNEKGNKRQYFKAFEKIKPGDLVAFYESSPTRQVIAIGEAVKGLHKDKEEVPGEEVDVITIKYAEDIPPIDWSEMANHELFQDSLFIRQGARGTLFEMTKEQYELLKNWEKSSLPDVEDHLAKIPSVDFNVDPNIEGLVFENIEILLEQVTTAIRNGKHIILTGPPGTGKSKLASRICSLYGVEPMMVTAASNWSTYETIGGYRPDREGNLFFDEGIFLKCLRDKETNQPINKWLIIDEINRADIDKAFGSLFSVLTGDEISIPFESKSGNTILLKPQEESVEIEPNDSTYVVPSDWRIVATMNTIDKASLYEMSYAFMRRFAFIPVGVPKDITTELIQQYLAVWGMETYPHADVLTVIWRLINHYRKIGPAIIEDIAKHSQDNEDFTSAIILYVLPQFEGLSVHKIKEFIAHLVDETDTIIDQHLLNDFVDDFFDAGGF